jgi:hypothetical protein
VTQLVFTLKVVGMAAPVPPATDWYVSFRAPDGVLRGVRMSTDSGAPRFYSYVVDAGGAGTYDGRFVASEGPIETSNFTAAGVITFVVKATDIGGTGAKGEVFKEFNAGTVANGVAVADVKDGMPDGLARAGTFTLTKNGPCDTTIKNVVPEVAGNTRLGGALPPLSVLLLGLVALATRRRRMVE